MIRTNERKNIGARLLIPIVSVLITAAFKELVERYAGQGPPLIFFYPAVVFSAMAGGLWAGLFATSLIIGIAMFFYLGPDYSFAVASPNDQFRLILFLVTALGLSWAFEVVNRQRYKLFLLDRAKERFIGILCHELRIPMNRTFLQLSSLIQDSATPESMRPSLTKLLQDAELESLLVQEVLLSVKAGHRKWILRREVLSLDMVIRQALEYVTAEAKEKNIQIDYTTSASDLSIFADKTGMMQLLWNLLRNAVKFSPVCARIHICVQSENEGTVTIRICDKGRGIEPSQLKQIFEPYQQTRKRDASDTMGGLGLGLWICKTIVAAHSGTISAYSEGFGKGTTITVRIPLAQKSAHTPSHPLSSSFIEPGVFIRKPVLIIEDDAVSLKLLSQLLTTLGIPSLTAQSVEEAKKIEASSLSCVIADMHLSDGTGWDLLSHFRKVQPSLKVFCLSGDSLKEESNESLKAFDLRLVKPVNVVELGRAIRSAT